MRAAPRTMEKLAAARPRDVLFVGTTQQRKQALARDLLGEDGFARALTRSDLEGLFAESGTSS